MISKACLINSNRGGIGVTSWSGITGRGGTDGGVEVGIEDDEVVILGDVSVEVEVFA